MIIPTKLEISYTRYPISNIVIILFTIVFSFLFFLEVLSFEQLESLLLQGWNIEQLIGHIFIHAGFGHLIGNMLFLWVFGNAICSTTGNIAYPFIYLILGFAAAATHLLFVGGAALGASGAVNGIVGMTLVLYPKNKLKIFYAFIWIFAGVFKVGNFRIRNYWMILFWFFWDVFGAISGMGNIAYMAHIGGFITGVLIASILLLTGAFETYSSTIKEEVIEKEFDLSDDEPISSKMHWDETDSSVKDASHLTSNLQLEEMKLEEEARQTLLQSSEAIPEFKVLRAVPTPEAITCYFVNKGDRISNISIEPIGSFSAEISPQDILEAGGTGAIKFMNFAESVDSNLKFELGYTCADGNRKSLEYIYSKTEKNISRI